MRRGLPSKIGRGNSAASDLTTKRQPQGAHARPAALGKAHRVCAAPRRAGLCEGAPSSTLSLRSLRPYDAGVTDAPPALPRSSAPRRGQAATISCKRGVPACRCGAGLGRVRGRASKAVLRKSRVGPLSIRESSTRASLACRESWRGRGCASSLMVATVRRKQFPRRYAPSSRGKFFAPPGPSRALRPLRGAASPSPAGRITTRTRWARPC